MSYEHDMPEPDLTLIRELKRRAEEALPGRVDLGVGLGDSRGRRRDSLGFGRVRLGFLGILGHGALRAR
jgi:hypothetical protein